MTIGWYNGWSPEERTAVTPIQREAVRTGAIPYPRTCSICGVTPERGSTNGVWLHSEDYARPLLVYPICRGCHCTLHMRFNEPDAWQRLIAAHSNGSRWFEQLSMNAASLTQAFDVTYPSGILPFDAETGLQADISELRAATCRDAHA